MGARKLGGRGRLMSPAVVYAREHGFAVTFTSGDHLAFCGYGRRVFAAGTPRSHRAALGAIQKMRAVLREAHGAGPAPIRR